MSYMPATGAATSPEKAEDSASASGDLGEVVLAVRQANATDLSAGGTDGDYEPLQVDALGRLRVRPEGNVASGAADSGNPVKVGGVYNSTLPTLTTGQRGDAQLDASGRVIVASSPTASAVGGYSYSHISTATTTAVKASPGYLHAISVNSKGTVASTIAVYDSLAGSGAVIGVIDSLNLSGAFILDVACTIGITIVTTGTVAPDLTVSYK